MPIPFLWHSLYGNTLSVIKKLLKVLLVLAGIFLLGWIIYQGAIILLYVVLAIVVSLIGRPIYDLLGKIHIRSKHPGDSLKAGLTILIIFGLLGFLGGVIFPLIINEAQVLRDMDVDKAKRTMSPFLEEFNKLAHEYDFNQGDRVTRSEALDYLSEFIGLSGGKNVFGIVMSLLGNLLIGVFSVAFIAFFLLRDDHLVPQLMLKLTPARFESNLINISKKINFSLSRYFIGLLVQILAVTTCVFIGLTLFGIENALMIAVFTGFVNLVPYIGPWIGATFAIFVVVSANLYANFEQILQPMFLKLFVVFAATQLLDNYIFQPTIFSKSIRAHPLEIFLVILTAGTLAGVAGMVAAIPVYSLLRIVTIELFAEFNWVEKIKGKSMS
jgi:predicted PurR-regulated permease PerM